MADLNEEVADWDNLYKSFSQHAAVIGRVTISWNMCQLLVFALFYELSAMTWEQARAVFFALKADVQQRDITMALALELPKTRSPRKKITSAVARLSELSSERNAAIHTMWQVSPERGGLVPAEAIPHNAKLQLDDPEGQFHRLDDELQLVHTALIKAVTALAIYSSQNKGGGQNLGRAAKKSGTSPQSKTKTR